MPAITINVSKKFADPDKQTLAVRASKIAAEVLGKPLAAVEVIVIDGAAIAFGGSCDQPAAYVVAAQIGPFTPEKRNGMTTRICQLLEENGIPGQRVYLHFDGGTMDDWGWL